MTTENDSNEQSALFDDFLAIKVSAMCDASRERKLSEHQLRTVSCESYFCQIYQRCVPLSASNIKIGNRDCVCPFILYESES